MHENEAYKRLLFHHEVMRAKLQIREYFLDHVVKEVYENIGQVLSFVRMQLAVSLKSDVQIPVERIIQSGFHIENAVKDLRKMVKNFYPDVVLYSAHGWVEIFASTVINLNLETDLNIRTQGDPVQIEYGSGLLLCKVLLDIFFIIKKQKAKITDCFILYLEDKVEVNIVYDGKLVQWNEIPKSLDQITATYQASILEQIELLEGSIKFKDVNTGRYQILLEAPFKSSLQ